MKRKFFIGSIGKPNEEYVNENWERCINEKAHVMHQDTIHKGVFDSVKTGSIFFLKYNDNLIAYGEVSTTNNPKDGSSDGWNMRVNVNEWFFYDSKNKKQGVTKYGVQENTLDGDQMATIKEVTSSFGLQKMKEIDNTTKLYKIIGNEFNQDINMEETTLLLTTNHNLILTGAPGTGKTYLAKQIAQQLIFDEVKGNLTDDEQKQFDEQCGFVQFHPSYDYTDFVEGLRPIQDDNGNVGFERKDGVFKEFCKKALSSGIVQTNIFDDCWDRLIDDIRNNLAIGNLTKIGNWEYGLSSKDSLKHASTTTPSQYSFTITKENVFSAWKGLRARPSGAFQKVMEDVVTFMKSKYNLGDFAFSSEENKNKNFVFIIDEINRGEISKIFGELFFSIDPGYRGKNGKVKTQYQNLVEVGDEFYDGFYVPENVYIIGTMNDIDRSVESMDFAFRRRFAFKEIKADKSMKMLDDENAWKDEQDNIVKPSTDVLGKLKNRMNNLNNKIWHKAKTDEKEEEKCIDGLSSAYHIGAAYFLKLKNYVGDADNGFENLWNNHLEGLLREYLRGSLNTEESIAKLKAAYNNESPENNG